MTDATNASPAMPQGTILERESRLSHSLIWRWMDEWYETHGVDAWSSNLVPNFVTSNSAIAAMYARVVLGFLTDVMGPRYRGRYDPRRPIYIVELGGGAGKFAFLLLQQLWEMRAFWPRASNADAGDTDDDDEDDAHADNESGAGPSRCPFVYVLTDVTASNVRFWSRHPCFASFVARGMLDFAVLDAQDCPEGVALVHSRRTLDRTSNTNPIFLIANYTLDTLKHDAFRMVHVDRPVPPESAAAPAAATSTATPAADAAVPAASSAVVPCLQLQEALISVASPSAYEPDRTDPTLIKRFRHAFTYRDVPSAVVPLYTQAATSIAAASAAAAPAPPPLPVIDYYSGRDADLNGVLGALQHRLACVPAATLSSPGAQTQSGAGAGSGIGSGYSVLVPLGGLRCLSFFLSISHSNLAFLCGDKSHTTLEELRGLRDPHLALHGSFSLMVNMEVLRLYLEAKGGGAAYTPHVDGFKVALFASMQWDRELRAERRGKQSEKMKKREGASAAGSSRFSTGASSSSSSSSSSVSVADTLSLPSSAVVAPALSPSAGLVARQLRATALAFHDLQSFSPDHFSTLQRCVRDECPPPGPSLKHLLALLRLSQGDADIFFKFRQQIIEQIGGSAGGAAPSDKLLRDLRYDLARVGAAYYPLSLAPPAAEADAAALSDASASAASAAAASAKDVSFELGRAAMALRDYSGAVDWFARSVVQCGPHHVTSYNAGLSHYYLAQFDDALRCFAAALQLCPEYEEAAEWRQRTQNKIAALKLRQQQQMAHAQAPQGQSTGPAAVQSTLPKSAAQTQTAAQSTQQRLLQSAASAAPQLNSANASTHAPRATPSMSPAAVTAASPFQPRNGHLPFSSTSAASTSAAPLAATTPEAESAINTSQFYTHTSNSWL